LEHGLAEKSANPAIRDHPHPQRCCRPLAPELWMGFEMSSSGDPFMSHLFEYFSQAMRDVFIQPVKCFL
jgi:hypothetical protein